MHFDLSAENVSAICAFLLALGTVLDLAAKPFETYVKRTPNHYDDRFYYFVKNAAKILGFLASVLPRIQIGSRKSK